MKYLMTFLMAACAWGQQLDLSTLDKLASKAKESSVVTLDPDKLKFASGFLSGDDAKGEKTKNLIASLKGVYVRSFEFAATGAYTQADLDPVRQQLKGPGWSKIIDVKEKDETSEIYFYTAGDKGGMAIISSEPTELTVVNIVGPVDLKSLAQIGGSFGVPNIRSGFDYEKKPRAPGSKEKPSNEDED
jgi:hypothetical protein